MLSLPKRFRAPNGAVLLMVMTGLLFTAGCHRKDKDKRELHASRLHSGPVTGVAFSPDGQVLASAGEDDMIRLLDVRDFGGETENPSESVALPSELAISPIQGSGHGFYDVEFSPDGARLAGGAFLYRAGGVIYVFDLTTGEEVSGAAVTTERVSCLSYSPMGDEIACGSGGRGTFGELSLWALETREVSTLIEERMGGVTDVVFSPDGDLLAVAGAEDTGAEDTTIEIIDLAGAGRGAMLDEDKHQPESLAFSPDGTLLASAGRDTGDFPLASGVGIIRIWDAATGDLLHSVEASSKALLTVAFSPNGELVAAAGEDFLIHIIRLSTLEQVDTLRGHARAINSVVFSPDGSLLASGSDDRYVRLWYVGDLLPDESDMDAGFDGDGGPWDTETETMDTETESDDTETETLEDSGVPEPDGGMDSGVDAGDGDASAA